MMDCVIMLHGVGVQVWINRKYVSLVATRILLPRNIYTSMFILCFEYNEMLDISEHFKFYIQLQK